MDRPRNSILIPHRNRHRYLSACLWSIDRSARHTGCWDWEIVIVDSKSQPPLIADCDFRPSIPANITRRLRLLADPNPAHPFNKPAVLGLAIDAARGDLITFLDCDMLVGRRWIAQAARLTADPTLSRIPYRVRALDKEEVAGLLALPPGPSLTAAADELFQPARYAALDPVSDRYREHGLNRVEPDYLDRCYGNSQGTMRREVFEHIRPDQSYPGRGFEDIEFLRQIENHFGQSYRGQINPDPAANLVHLGHDRDPADWADPAYAAANRARYLGIA